LPHPVTGGWPPVSGSEDANEDGTGGARLLRTLAGRRRQRTANGNGCGDDESAANSRQHASRSAELSFCSVAFPKRVRGRQVHSVDPADARKSTAEIEAA
jgi:hypothetical protein